MKLPKFNIFFVGNSSKIKKRGPTSCYKIHASTLEEREEVTLNRFGQPIGPTERVVSNLSMFLGSIARNSDWCPLNYTNWKAVPDKEGIWNYVQVLCFIF